MVQVKRVGKSLLNATKRSSHCSKSVVDEPDAAPAGTAVDPVLAKLAAILSPTLAAVFGKQQTQYESENSLPDPNESQDPASQSQTAGPLQGMQQFMPQGAPPVAAQQPAPPVDPTNTSAGMGMGNPIAKGPIGGSGMNGVQSLSNMKAGSSPHIIYLWAQHIRLQGA
jgi:hypothetical protein